MATIKAFIRTSSKNKAVNIRIRLSDGRDFTRYGITNIIVSPEHWDAKKEELKARVVLPENINRTEINESIRNIKNKIEVEYSNSENKSLLPKDWIDTIINNKSAVVKEKQFGVLDFFDLYIDSIKASELRKKQVYVVKRMISRYFTIKNKNNFRSEDAIDFEVFLREEYLYQDKYPLLYKGEREIKPRGRTTINAKIRILKTVFNWAIRKGFLEKHPYLNYTSKPDVYGDPIPLLKEEVDFIFESTVPKEFELIKDMFCLQCYLGCRVGDFVRLTKDNINDDFLIYIANKTISEKATTVYVPLIDKAIQIINKYDCEDGRLLPFINVNGKDGYNKKIKQLAKFLNLDRNIVVLNQITEKSEHKKLYEVISSHTARKTFINSNYKETQDPSLIAKMTGHADDSKAFSRYRNIDMDILREQMKKAFDKKTK